MHADSERLDLAITQLRLLHKNTLVAYGLEVGRFLIETFFDGDPAL